MFHIRNHDGARVRIWTKPMEAYGQFNVLPLQDVEIFKSSLDKMNLSAEASVTVHHCDTAEECKCRKLTFGETVEAAL